MKKYRFLTICLLIFSVQFLIACETGKPANPGPVISSTPTAEAPSVPPTHTSTPTNTLTPTSTPTETPSPTPTALPEKLVISEIMATNKSYAMNGSLCDWIELYNAGDSDIDLSGFFLSDKENKPLKARLPQVILKPSEYIVLTCDNEIILPGAEEKTVIKGDLSFKLSSDGETVTLTRADGLKIDSVTYENLESDYSVTKDGICSLPSPGFSNDKAGHRKALELVAAAAMNTETPGLVINEILSSNNHFNKYTSSTKLAGYYDMLELYNASTDPILLSNYYLSDSAKHLLDYRLPNVTLEPGKYYLLYCVGRATVNYDNPGILFTQPELPIELSYFGETLYLTHKDGLIYDCVSFPEMYDGVSYGRSPSAPSMFVLQKEPTLGKPNSEGQSDFSTAPIADIKSGAYSGSISVSFTSPGTIYYTLDSSAPTTSSKVWDGKPLTFSTNTTLRAISVEGDKLKSFEAVYNYFLNPYDFTLDVVSVSMSAKDFAAISASQSKAPTYAINVALYKNNRNGNTLVLDEEFSANAIIELCGASTLYADKTSYQIKFKSKYGPSKLQYKLFDTSDIEEFNSFTLRGGSQDNVYTLLRDEALSSLLYSYYGEELILHENYRPVNLYINNEYRGIYYIREHEDKAMIASHYDVDEEDVIMAKNMLPTTVRGGTSADKAELTKAWELIKNGDLNNPAVFNQLCDIVDYDTLLTYWATMLWSADNDCHLRAYKIRGGKWKIALHDQDLAMRETCNYVYTDKFFNEKRTTAYRVMLKGLLRCDKFRADLLARLGEFLKTAYSTDYCVNYVKENFINVIAHDMEYNCELWGGTRLYVKNPNSGSRIATYSVWKSRCNQLTKMMSGRSEELVTALKKFMNLTAEEEQKYFRQ